MFEKNHNQYVAQFKFTVLVLSNSTQRLNEGFSLPWVTSDYKIEVDPQLTQIMAMSTKRNKKKKKKKSKKQGTQENNEDDKDKNEGTDEKEDKMETV